MPEIIIETQRLILRTEAAGDQAIWAQHMNTPAVMDHLGGPRELQMIEANFAKIEAHYAQHGFCYMMMQHKASGTLIGNCGVALIQNDYAPKAIFGQVEIGWTLREDYWRRGYAFEAASAVLDYAFARLDAPRIFAFTADRNIASWRMMEKLGMERWRDLDFADPDYPERDNPTIVYVMERPQ
jgi:RimJ/RimL family protein N-acetyltransferase